MRLTCPAPPHRGGSNLTDYDRSKLALTLKSFFAEKAKEKQACGQGGVLLLQKSAEAIKPIDTRAELAQIAGVSHDTIAKVEKIEQKAAPELKKA